ncbi:MAG: glycosyltransferase family 9 protein [Nitrospinae bacterium]|nr:glycosyltransferase family 9 protein [Nitrospinota bacterium]
MGKIIHELKKVSGRLILPALISKRKTNPEKILVVKDNSIGDFLLFSGILNFYIRHFGREQMYCLVSKSVEEVAKLYTDNVVVMDEKKYFASFEYRYELLSELKGLGFETAINSILNSSESRDMLYILRAPTTCLYGGVVMKLRKPRRWKNIANIIPELSMFDDKDIYTHVFNHEKYFMERILNLKVSDDEVKPYIPLNNNTSEKIINKFSLQKGDYIVFSFGSRSTKKDYPAYKFMEVIKYLHRQLGMKAVLIGVDQYNSAALPDFVIDLRRKTSLIEAFGIIRHARLFIGNETGITHASWIMGVPTVMIYGGGHFGGFLPMYDNGRTVYKYMDCYCCNWGCKYDDIPVRCIGEINTADIVKSAEELLS